MVLMHNSSRSALLRVFLAIVAHIDSLRSSVSKLTVFLRFGSGKLPERSELARLLAEFRLQERLDEIPRHQTANDAPAYARDIHVVASTCLAQKWPWIKAARTPKSTTARPGALRLETRSFFKPKPPWSVAIPPGMRDPFFI